MADSGFLANSMLGNFDSPPQPAPRPQPQPAPAPVMKSGMVAPTQPADQKLAMNVPPDLSAPAAPSQASNGGAPAAPQPGATQAPPDIAPLVNIIYQREGSGDTDISPKGAVGKGQVMPGTAAQYLAPGADPKDPAVQRQMTKLLLDPKVNAKVTQAYIQDLHRRYPHDPQAVLVAYNAGPKKADEWLASGKNPSVLAEETRNYIGPTLSEQWSQLTPQERQLMQQRTNATDATMQSLGAMAQNYMRDAAQAPPGSKERDDMIAQYRKNLDQMQDEWRKKVASPPVEAPMDAMKNFGSATTVLALLGGLLSRRHLTAGLNAAAAAMNAVNTNNHERFEKDYETWKTQTELGLHMIDMENRDIQSLVQDKRLSIDEKNARLQTMVAEMGFVKEIGGMKMDNVDTGIAFMEKRQTLAAQAQNHADMLQMHYDQMKQMHDDRMAALSARTGGGNAILDEKTLGQMADQYLAGDKSVMTGLGYGNIGAQNRAALRTEIEKQATAHGMSGRDIATAIAEYQGLAAGERSLGTRTAQMGMAVDEAKQLIPQVLETSANVDRTQFPTLNKIILAGEQGTGDPNVVKLGIAINSFINVYARAISPTGVPTVSDKDHARELLESSWSQGQIVAGMDQITKELEAGARAPRDVVQEFRERGTTQVSQPQIGNFGPAATPTISSQSAYDALSSGSHYLGPDGHERIKP